MKITLNFKLQKNVISSNYRAFIVSFFKYTLSNFNSELYEKYYPQQYEVKNFCFSTYFKSPVFDGEKITVNEEFSVTLSVFDFSDAIDWYNAFLKMKNKVFPIPMQNSMVLKYVMIENHKTITNNTITVKMLSPVAVRNVTGKKSCYLSYNDRNFINQLTQISLNMLSKTTDIEKSEIFLEIEAVSPKKTVTCAFGTNITANLGIYKIHSDPLTLNRLYMLGIGSRRSEGFGMFEVIAEEMR